ncbi:MAG: dipeptidyl carboxypeptidase II, partial [Acidobacteriaceae bacterium]
MSKGIAFFAACLAAAAIFMTESNSIAQIAAFGPSNPFYAPSRLPFHAPPFDRINDADYQPAIEAGMAEQEREVLAIAGRPAPPTFENTFVALEKSGQLLNRVIEVFQGVTSANTNPTLEKVQEIEAPKLAAHSDSIYLNPKLFARVKAIYDQRAGLHLDPESLRLVEYQYDQFVHAGAALSEPDREKLKKLNEEAATLEDQFTRGLLKAAKDAAFVTTDPAALAGLSATQIESAKQAAAVRKVPGYVIPLQNTTQQPDLAVLTDRATREALFE